MGSVGNIFGKKRGEGRKMLNLCSASSHEDICFEGKDCPLCEVLNLLEDAREEIARLKKEE